MMRRTTGLAIAALALTVTGACSGSSSDGGGSGDEPGAATPTSTTPSATTPAPTIESVDPDKRPTAEQIASTLKVAGFPAKEAGCFSKGLEKSKLSDRLLAALVNRDPTFKLDAKSTKIYERVVADVQTTCQ